MSPLNAVSREVARARVPLRGSHDRSSAFVFEIVEYQEHRLIEAAEH